MEDKLRRYVDGLFARTVPSKRAIELKEEMLQNLHDKYDDLISDGKAPEAAYNIVIAGIGDVRALLSELEADSPDPEYTMENDLARKKSAMMTSIAVMLYVLCTLPLIILSLAGSFNAARIGVPTMFLLIAAATGLLVYNHMTKPRYHRNSNTMVDEFREWQAGSKDRKALRRAISSALWAILVALYVIVSFSTEAWHLTWIVFVLGAAVEAIINIFFAVR